MDQEDDQKPPSSSQPGTSSPTSSSAPSASASGEYILSPAFFQAALERYQQEKAQREQHEESERAPHHGAAGTTNGTSSSAVAKTTTSSSSSSGMPLKKRSLVPARSSSSSQAAAQGQAHAHYPAHHPTQEYRKKPRTATEPFLSEATDTASLGDGDADADAVVPEGGGKLDLSRKRLASRVSSRRTREREKLRLDHFRNAKLQLEHDNKKLEDENGLLREFIKQTKAEKTTGIAAQPALEQPSAVATTTTTTSAAALTEADSLNSVLAASHNLTGLGAATNPSATLATSPQVQQPQQFQSQQFQLPQTNTSSGAATPNNIPSSIQSHLDQQHQQSLQLLQPLLAANPNLLLLLSNPLLLSSLLLGSGFHGLQGGQSPHSSVNVFQLLAAQQQLQQPQNPTPNNTNAAVQLLAAAQQNSQFHPSVATSPFAHLLGAASPPQDQQQGQFQYTNRMAAHNPANQQVYPNAISSSNQQPYALLNPQNHAIIGQLLAAQNHPSQQAAAAANVPSSQQSIHSNSMSHQATAPTTSAAASAAQLLAQQQNQPQPRQAASHAAQGPHHPHHLAMTSSSNSNSNNNTTSTCTSSQHQQNSQSGNEKDASSE
jgi:hypothetical protein